MGQVGLMHMQAYFNFRSQTSSDRVKVFYALARSFSQFYRAEILNYISF